MMNNDNLKNKLNIVGKCYVKQNSVGGEILSYVPDLPIMGYLDDFLFIFTVPTEEQNNAPVYVRLQEKEPTVSNEVKSLNDVDQVRSVGFFKENRSHKGDIIVCAPREHILADFAQLVVIATIPSSERNSSPVFFKRKMYQKSKKELEPVEQAEELTPLEENVVDELLAEVV
jgi:hypothetical protein